jgi:four helix bundle protein
MTARHNVIKEKSYLFALDIIHLVKELPRNTAGYALGKQIIRSGTSIGENIEEAIGASSKNDFTYKMCVAKKEARETLYWLGLIADSKLTNNYNTNKLADAAKELIRILTAIVKTAAQ